jgi:hypothetical protein
MGRSALTFEKIEDELYIVDGEITVGRITTLSNGYIRVQMEEGEGWYESDTESAKQSVINYFKNAIH